MSTGEMEIQIGIETELYLDPRDPAFDQEYPQYTELGLRKLGEVFKNYYNDKKPSPFARIRLDFVNEDAKSELEEYSDPEDPQEYSKWSIMSDSSLKRDPTQGKSVRWPIELASPILPFKEKGGHRTEVEVHFEVLHSFAIAAVNRTCGKISWLRASVF